MRKCLARATWLILPRRQKSPYFTFVQGINTKIAPDSTNLAITAR